MEKVLHITNWYPYNDANGDFIQRHIDTAKSITDSQMIHIEVKTGKFKLVNTLDNNMFDRRLILWVPTNSYKVKELLTFLLIFYFIKQEKEKYDLYLFHIAYPSLIYTRLIKKIIKGKIAIFEHWSAYSQGFFLPEKSKARERIASIFCHEIPVIAVSKFLMGHIENFAKCKDFPKYIIPNVINEEFFYLKNPVEKKEIIFFMAASWSSQYKLLMVGVKAFNEAIKYNKNLILYIAGEGKQIEVAKKYIKDNPILKDKIVFLGNLSYEKVGYFMRMADLFLHPSKMETFSLVCAEALFCGTPVFASDIPAIREYLTKEDGKLLDNNQEDWNKAVLSFLKNPKSYDYKKVGVKVRKSYSRDAVSSTMKNVFKEITKELL